MARPAFSRRHYRVIARALLAAKPEPQRVARDRYWRELVGEFAHELARDNPRFNRVRFYQAAGAWAGVEDAPNHPTKPVEASDHA